MSSFECARRTGDAAAARGLLSDTFRWLTEGFDTADWKDANATSNARLRKEFAFTS
jgi:hypothetical protein